MGEQKQFIHCEKCGKRLIARLPNGAGEFIFGKQADCNNKSPVHMKIWGIVELACLSWTCDHLTTLAFFPTKNDTEKKNDNL